MHLSESLLLALSALPAVQASLYSKKSPVLQVDGKSYKSLIAKSNYTSIVEFYAPWCGHCKNLAPDYQKVATRLSGLANVAAVNCDEESNKPFCGSMGVQGFPTLKIVKPGKKSGKPSVSDYQGPRSAKDIIEAVQGKMPNHVTRVKDGSIDDWLGADGDRPKALIVGEKGLVPSLAKALAIDFLGAINVGYARSNDKSIVAKYAIASFPAVVILQDGKDSVIYDGEINKSALIDFLSQAAPPNPGALKPSSSPSPKSTKKDAKKDAKKNEKKDAKQESKKEDKKDGKRSGVENAKRAGKDEAASCPHAAGQVATHNPHTDHDKDTTSSEPSEPDTQPGAASAAAKLRPLESEAVMQEACLHSMASTCVLAVVPDAEARAAQVLAEISRKHMTRGAPYFPMFAVTPKNDAAQALVKTLELSATHDKPLLLAVNAKRSWFSVFEGDQDKQTEVEKWIDDIILGDMKKQKLPNSVVSEFDGRASKDGDSPKHGEL